MAKKTDTKTNDAANNDASADTVKRGHTRYVPKTNNAWELRSRPGQGTKNPPKLSGNHSAPITAQATIKVPCWHQPGPRQRSPDRIRDSGRPGQIHPGFQPGRRFRGGLNPRQGDPAEIGSGPH